jgi:hypothetical protein
VKEKFVGLTVGVLGIVFLLIGWLFKASGSIVSSGAQTMLWIGLTYITIGILLFILALLTAEKEIQKT